LRVVKTDQLPAGRTLDSTYGMTFMVNLGERQVTKVEEPSQQVMLFESSFLDWDATSYFDTAKGWISPQGFNVTRADGGVKFLALGSYDRFGRPVAEPSLRRYLAGVLP
jgi:hypothetical protein